MSSQRASGSECIRDVNFMKLGSKTVSGHTMEQTIERYTNNLCSNGTKVINPLTKQAHRDFVYRLRKVVEDVWGGPVAPTKM